MTKDYRIILALFLFIFVILLFAVIYVLVTMTDSNSNIIDNNDNDNNDSIIINNRPNRINSDNNTLDVTPTNDPIYPINSSVDFQQLGTISSLTTDDEDNPTTPMILPLFGKKLFKDRWTYYTTTDNDKNLRIEVIHANRGCMTDRIGCDMINNDDIVIVPAYNDKQFKVFLYKYANTMYFS